MSNENDSKQHSPEMIIRYFKDKFNTKIKKAEIKKRTAGAKKNEIINIWMEIDKSIFKDTIKHLCDYQFPHLAVVSGNDYPKSVELIYHFSLDFGKNRNEISVNIAVEIPKTKPEIESICDLIPGALITEREKQEMLGIKVIDIPDNRRLFLPDDFPKGVYPWRKNEKGLEKLIRNLHEVKK
jgi:membrane-bound hydrogenase subunit beta